MGSCGLYCYRSSTSWTVERYQWIVFFLYFLCRYRDVLFRLMTPGHTQLYLVGVKYDDPKHPGSSSCLIAICSQCILLGPPHSVDDEDITRLFRKYQGKKRIRSKITHLENKETFSYPSSPWRNVVFISMNDESNNKIFVVLQYRIGMFCWIGRSSWSYWRLQCSTLHGGECRLYSRTCILNRTQRRIIHHSFVFFLGSFIRNSIVVNEENILNTTSKTVVFLWKLYLYIWCVHECSVRKRSQLIDFCGR